MYLLELRVRSSYFWMTWGRIKKWSSGKNSYTCWRVRVFTWLHQKPTKLRKYYDAPIFVTSIAPIMFAGKSANIKKKKKKAMIEARWSKFQLSVQVPLPEHETIKRCARCFCELVFMRTDAQSFQSTFIFFLAFNTVSCLHINYLINKTWIYILLRLENTSWVVSWRKVFESLNCF